jgi:hypothetical protein
VPSSEYQAKILSAIVYPLCLGLFFFFLLDFPNFISSCCFGFMRIRDAIRRLVCSIWSWFFVMSDQPKEILTVEHFARFGVIIHSFARLEYLIQAAMAAASGLDDSKLVILTKGLSYSQKRDTFYSYLEIYPLVDKAHVAKLKDFFDRAHTYNPLRNNIAHALWRPGVRPGTIRAGYVDVRYGKGKVVGYNEDDKDYTVDELGDVANALHAIVNDLIRYLRDSGIDAAIASKIEDTNRVI